MMADVPWITLGSVPDDMRVKNHSWNKWCVFFMVGGCEPQMEPNTDMRKQESNERGEEKEERRRDRWCNRWYILPGGSQGRGEGGSAIRQHTQEGGGQNISSVSKIRIKGK